MSRPASQISSAASSVQPPAKTAEAREEALLFGAEQFVRPGDSRPQGALARGEVAGAAGQEREALREPFEQRAWGEHLDASGRELDRERQVVEPAADLGHLAVRCELDTHRACALVEEGDGVRIAQRQDDVLTLAREMERLAARHEQRQLRAGGDELSELGAAPSRCSKLSSRSSSRFGADVLGKVSLCRHDLRDRRGDKRGFAQAGEPDPEDAVRVDARRRRRPPERRVASCRIRPRRSASASECARPRAARSPPGARARARGKASREPAGSSGRAT